MTELSPRTAFVVLSGEEHRSGHDSEDEVVGGAL